MYHIYFVKYLVIKYKKTLVFKLKMRESCFIFYIQNSDSLIALHE